MSTGWEIAPIYQGVLSGFRMRRPFASADYSRSAGLRTPLPRRSVLYMRVVTDPLPIHPPLPTVEAFGSAEDDFVVGVPGKHPGVVHYLGFSGVGRTAGAAAFRAAGRDCVGGGGFPCVAAGGGQPGFLRPSVGLAVGVFCLRLSDVSVTAVLVGVARRLPVFACLAPLPRGFPPQGV